MNRAERRAAERAKPGYLRMPADKRMEKLVRNGITPQDLDREYERGFKAGFDAGCETSIKTCYAAAVLALRKLMKFGKERCMRILREMDNTVVYSLNGQDEVDRVYKELGIEMRFKEFDRIKERG